MLWFLWWIDLEWNVKFRWYEWICEKEDRNRQELYLVDATVVVRIWREVNNVWFIVFVEISSDW